MKCVICMSLQVNILCLICINCQYPKIALNLTMMHEFCSIFIGNTVKQGRSLTHVVSPDEIQHVRSKSECLLSECWREENISCKALGLWFLSLFQDLVRRTLFVQPGAKINSVYYERRNFLLYTTENVLPNDNVSMSVGHLDHVLIVYSSMEHVIWKSPGPMCGWVDRILHPDSCTTMSSWSKVPLLSIWSVTVPLCRPLLPCPSWWHGSLPRHGLWWLTCELHCSPLPWRLGSVYQLWQNLLPVRSRAPSRCKQSRRDQDVRLTSKHCH